MAWRALLVLIVAVSSVASAYAWGPASWSRRPAALGDTHSPMIPFIREASAMIPPGAAVSSFYGWGTHLDHRERIYDFPVPWHAQNWGTFKEEGQRLPEADAVDYVIVPAAMEQKEQKILAELVMPSFEVVYRRGGVLLLHRRGGTRSVRA
jgi:hypothetical protein